MLAQTSPGLPSSGESINKHMRRCDIDYDENVGLFSPGQGAWTKNCKYGVSFGRKLLCFVEERFPNCGTDKEEQCAANFLDPRYKCLHLNLFDKFETTKNNLENMSKARNFDGSSISENNIINVLPIAANALSPTSRLRQKIHKAAKTPQFQSILMNEFATYENLPIYIGQDILGWWKTHSEMLPVLSKLPQLYLAIPATSTQSEY